MSVTETPPVEEETAGIVVAKAEMPPAARRMGGVTRNGKVSALVMAGIAGSVIAACQTSTGNPGEDPVTIDIKQLAHTIREHRGRLVRTCGRLDGPDNRGRWVVMEAEGQSPPMSYFDGPPMVFVFPCPNGPPRLDAEGCVAGRVVPRDESVLNPPGGIIAINDAPVNYDWYLRPQCPVAG